MAIFEEAITKPFVAQVMQDISDTMFWRMELAKAKGLRKVREVAQEGNMLNYYELIEGISQEKHNKVFSGKIKTYGELTKFDHTSMSSAKTYSYLLEKIETDEREVFEYNIKTIFI